MSVYYYKLFDLDHGVGLNRACGLDLILNWFYLEFGLGFILKMVIRRPRTRLQVH